MDYQGINAGLEPGGAQKTYEARILICYLLNLLQKPLSKQDINNILQYKTLVNYFTFAEAFNELLKDEQLIENNVDDSVATKPQYILTEKGKKTSYIFENSIAVTIKEKLAIAAKEYFENKKSLQDNVVTITKVEDGYMVLCRVKDIGSDLITINIFAPDKKIAEQIKRNFIKGSFELYQHIFGFLTS